jgi:hypothetical protein
MFAPAGGVFSGACSPGAWSPGHVLRGVFSGACSPGACSPGAPSAHERGCERTWSNGNANLRCGSAGINRRRIEDERALHERSSEPSWPRVMRDMPQDMQRSVDRGKRRPAIELRNPKSGTPTLSHQGEGHTGGGDRSRAAARSRGVEDPVHARTSGAREPGESGGSRGLSTHGTVGEGLWPQARRERLRAVRHRRSTDEGIEQSRPQAGCGDEGGKADDQGES